MIDEKLGTFFECVSVWERKIWLAQENHSKQDQGISTMGKWTMNQIRTAHSTNKVIKNAPNYEIISDSKYQTAFQFVPIEYINTPEE